VEVINGYSAHADRDELLEWIGHVNRSGRLREVFLVHGDPPEAEALASKLRHIGVREVVIPVRGFEVEI